MLDHAKIKIFLVLWIEIQKESHLVLSSILMVDKINNIK